MAAFDAPGKEFDQFEKCEGKVCLLNGGKKGRLVSAALQVLLSHGYVINAILLPALIVVFHAEGFFFSIADRLHAVFGYSLLQ